MGHFLSIHSFLLMCNQPSSGEVLALLTCHATFPTIHPLHKNATHMALTQFILQGAPVEVDACTGFISTRTEKGPRSHVRRFLCYLTLLLGWMSVVH